MKFRFLALSFCVGLLILSLTGCGMKVPTASGASANASASSETGAPVVGGAASTIFGVVENISAGTITLKTVQPFDASEKTAVSPSAASTAPATSPAATSAASNYIGSGSKVYTLSGATQTMTFGSAATVILEDNGYTAGTLNDVKNGDFLAIVLSGETVIAVIDNGPVNNPADQNSHGTGTSGGMETVSPSPSPSASATPSPSPSPGTGSTGTTDGKTYIVNTDNLKARNGPGTNYEILGQMTMGTKLTGVVENGWLKFTLSGKTAYCDARYLKAETGSAASSSPAPSASGTPKPSASPASSPSAGQTTSYKVVNTTELKIRSGPGTSYEVIGKLAQGDKIDGVITNGWCKFTYKEQTAYCSADYLKAAD